MALCPACGHENRQSARFCDSCGAALTLERPAQEERKVVTVLFADLVGFTQRAETMDPEDVRALLQPYWQRLRSELERFGGTVEKFIGDAVMALFGAPVVHEDDPERAVRAALAIRDWVREEEDLQVRVAVNTGEALVLLGARPDEGEGMATGDVVNTTARLQAAAPTNGILVGETTWRATRDRVDYAEAEPVTAKGKAEPIPVWEPLQARARLGMDLEQQALTPLVGRERELAALVDAFERVEREREPQLLTLMGVPGIGKSRLVAEFFQLVDSRPELVWWRQGRALPYGAGVSFWALGEMVKAQAGIHENDAEDEAAEKLRASVAEIVDEHERDWVLRQLETLVGLGDDTAVDRTEAFAGWRRYLEGLAEVRPLILVFEDLHWADDGLLDFVDHLAEWATGAPLFVLGTARPELLDRRLDWGGGKLNAATLALSPLDDADAARVISGVLEQALLPAEMQSALLERAGGNPLYAEQFARLFVERGTLEETALPENVQGIIAARLDGLPGEEKRLLQDAAVLGKVFWSGGTSSLTGFGADQLGSVLHALERKGFVRRERRSAVAGEAEYAFRHVLVREVAYGQIPRPARAEKHVAAGEWVESLGREEDHAELLAHHYATALELTRAAGRDDPELAERARLALRRAGDRAAALNSFAVAAGFYGQALELWPVDDRDRGRLLLGLARAEFLGGEPSSDLLREAVAAALASGLPDVAAEAEAVAAEAAWFRGEGDEVRACIDRALELVEELPASRSKAWILSQASRYSMLGGRHDEAVERAQRALQMAAELGLKDVRAHALNNLGSTRARGGNNEGIADLEESIRLATEINSPELARALNNLASIQYAHGNIRACFELEERSIATAERFGLGSMLRFSKANVLGSRYRLGLWDEVLEGAESVLADAPPEGPESAARDMRGLVKFGRGDLAGALEDSERALEISRRAGDPQALYPSLAMNMLIRTAAGDHEGARARAGEILDRDTSDARIPFAAGVDVIDGLITLAGRERLRQWLSAWSVGNRPFLDAAFAFTDGDFDRAAQIYERCGDLVSKALVHLRAAQSLVEAGRRVEADRHLQLALGFFRSVGAAHYVREAESLLAASA